jgi:hypothetical protein
LSKTAGRRQGYLMKEKKYRIIFKGEILPNANLEEVKQKLAVFYKVDIKEIESLFSGKNFVLKENATLDAAQDYMYQLEQAGALCQLVEMETVSKNDSLTTPTTGTAVTTETLETTKATGTAETTATGAAGTEETTVTTVSTLTTETPETPGTPETAGTTETTDTTDTTGQIPKTTAAEAKKEIIVEKQPEEQTPYELRYRLFFKGETLAGKDINEVKTNLSMFYKVKPDQLAGLFTGKPVTVTPESTDFWTAATYLNRFNECGAVSYLEPVEAPESVKEIPDKFKIIFWGELQEGQDLLAVKTNLASMLNVPGPAVDKLFPGKPVLVKTDLSQDAAQSFKLNFETTGARCQVLKLSEKPQPSTPDVPDQVTEAVLPQPPAAPRQFTYQMPRQPSQTGKKPNVVTLLVIAGAIFAVFVIFKIISGPSSSEPGPTPTGPTATLPGTPGRSPAAQSSTPQPQPQAQTPSSSRLQAEPTKTLEDPNKYFSVSLPEGYVYINESKEKHSKILFNYSANINVTITAYPITGKRNHQEAMYAKVTEIESGNAGPLSRLGIKSYDLANFSGLEGYEIYLEQGTQMVHMYELVSPDNIAFSIIIVTIGDNNQENHDILDSAVRKSLKF